MQTFLDAVRDALAAESDLAPQEIRLETPRDPKLGDIAFPCAEAGALARVIEGRGALVPVSWPIR